MIAHLRTRYRAAACGALPARILAYLLLALAVSANCCCAGIGTNPTCGTLPRPQDTIWLISSRQAGCCPGNADCGAGLRFYQLQVACETGPGAWRQVDEAAFFGHGPVVGTTVFFVHGNRVSADEAFCRGLAAYRALLRFAASDQPVRFVTWSWPTAPLRGPIKDARIKARRAGPAGYRLACLVNRMDPSSAIGMIGFSFGARVVTGALHVLGGGRLGRLALSSPHPDTHARIHVVLLTAALDNDWLLPGHYHGRALSQMDHLFLLNNSCDRAMKWYAVVDRCRRPTPLGRWGLCSIGRLGADGRKIVQRDACCQLGQVHSFQNFLCHPALMRQAWAHLSFEPGPLGNSYTMTDRSVE